MFELDNTTMTGIMLAELQAFHEIDRRAYALFAYQLGLNCYTSKKIVAFWYWLETAGCKNFAHNALRLSPGMLQLLVMESTWCLNCVDGLPFYDSGRGDLLLMSVVGGKHLSLEFFYKNKGIAKKGISIFIRDVLDRVLSDLTQPIDAQSQEDNGSNSQIAMENSQEDNGNQSQGNREATEANEDLHGASQTDRTLFVTFSRGHPITKQQLAEFFNR